MHAASVGLLSFTVQILDKTSWRLQVASLHEKQGEFDEAVKLYDELIGINQENWDYYHLLLKAKKLLPDNAGALLLRDTGSLQFVTLEQGPCVESWR